MNHARTAALTEPFTPPQQRAYNDLSTAIEEVCLQGAEVPCLSNREAFDQRRPSKNRRRLCEKCPVFDRCRAYADSGAPVRGYVAGRNL